MEREVVAAVREDRHLNNKEKAEIMAIRKQNAALSTIMRKDDQSEQF